MSRRFIIFATPFRGVSRSSAGIGLQVFLEPMMGVRFLVEGVDFDISFLSVQCLSLGEGPIRFKMEHCKSRFPGQGLKGMENFACHTPPARVCSRPHSLDLTRCWILALEHATSNRMAIQSGHDKVTPRGNQILVGSGIAPDRIETCVETLRQFQIILLYAPARLGPTRYIHFPLHRDRFA